MGKKEIFLLVTSIGMFALLVWAVIVTTKYLEVVDNNQPPPAPPPSGPVDDGDVRTAVIRKGKIEVDVDYTSVSSDTKLKYESTFPSRFDPANIVTSVKRNVDEMGMNIDVTTSTSLDDITVTSRVVNTTPELTNLDPNTYIRPNGWNLVELQNGSLLMSSLLDDGSITTSTSVSTSPPFNKWLKNPVPIMTGIEEDEVSIQFDTSIYTLFKSKNDIPLLITQTALNSAPNKPIISIIGARDIDGLQWYDAIEVPIATDDVKSNRVPMAVFLDVNDRLVIVVQYQHLSDQMLYVSYVVDSMYPFDLVEEKNVFPPVPTFTLSCAPVYHGNNRIIVGIDTSANSVDLKIYEYHANNSPWSTNGSSTTVSDIGFLAMIQSFTTMTDQNQSSFMMMFSSSDSQDKLGVSTFLVEENERINAPVKVLLPSFFAVVVGVSSTKNKRSIIYRNGGTLTSNLCVLDSAGQCTHSMPLGQWGENTNGLGIMTDINNGVVMVADDLRAGVPLQTSCLVVGDTQYTYNSSVESI